MVLAAVLLVSQISFLDQAFHIDDRLYLEMAEQALETPLFPQDVQTTFEGLPVADLAGHSHLPLVSWYLALVRLLTGSQSETLVHLFMLVFPLLAVVSMYDLGRRWCGRGPTAALLLAFSPAFLVLSHTLMTDVPMLALWLVAISRWQALLDGDGGRWDRLWVAAAVVAAGFISLLAAGLVLLLAASWWLAPDRARAARLRPLLIAIVVGLASLWLLWYARAWLHYDRFVLLSTLGHMSERATLDFTVIGSKAFSFLLNTGGALLFPLAIFYGFGGPITRRVALLAGAASLIPIFAADSGQSWAWLPALAVALFAASGVLVAGRALAALSIPPRTVRATQPFERLVGLWFGGILAACLLLYSAGSVRYVLLALPPVILLWIGQIQRRYQSLGVPGLLAVGVLMTALWAWPVAASDYRFAESYRQGARQLLADYSGHTVWFTAEWGLRHYLEAGGGRLLTRQGQGPEVGDIVIKPRVAFPWVTRYDGRLETVEVRYPEPELAVRILDFDSHAGFYSTAWGILPFSVGSGPWEMLIVYRVTGRPDSRDDP